MSKLMRLLRQMRFLPRTQGTPENQDNSPFGIEQLCSPNDSTVIVYPPRKSFASGIEQLYIPKDTPVEYDIVLVHGVTGGREATWTPRNATEPWPQTLFPDEFPTARVLAFGYDVNAVKWPDVVSESLMASHATNLHESLSSYRERDGTNERPIIFICHELGGLVCEHALLVSSRSLLVRSIRGILFLGTPHSEAGIARWAETVSRSIGLVDRENSDSVNALRRDSIELARNLARNQDYFHKVVEARCEQSLPSIKITCFYEELPLGEDFVVPKDSAIRPGCTSIKICSDHENMTKDHEKAFGLFVKS